MQPARNELPELTRPRNWLTGRRRPSRRFLSRVFARINRAVDLMFAGRWARRRLEQQLELHDVKIRLRRGGAGLDGMRIAFLSDAHVGFVTDAPLITRIAARVADAKPDLVCFGGDLINTREREILCWREALSLLAAPLGMYAVPGNHDHFFGPDIGLWSSFLREHRVEVLVNRGVRIERGGDSLWLAGIDDLTDGEPDLAAALAGRREDEPTILLSHHPDVFEVTQQLGVDLQLSGHTHGGQILIFRWAPITHSRFGWWRGHHQQNGAQLYVGRGVGVTLLPLRIGVPNEIPIFVLRTGA